MTRSEPQKWGFFLGCFSRVDIFLESSSCCSRIGSYFRVLFSSFIFLSRLLHRGCSFFGKVFVDDYISALAFELDAVFDVLDN